MMPAFADWLSMIDALASSGDTPCLIIAW